jgi:DNA-binding CsgD family transcriptional regulator
MPALPDGARDMTRLERRAEPGRRRTDSELLGTCAAMTAVLDRLRQGTMVVDGGGRVSFANRMAQQLTAEGDGVRIRGGRLSGVAQPDAALLAKAIEAASGGAPEQVLRLRRTCGRRPLLVSVSPVGNLPSARGPVAGHALLLITDPAALILPRKERLAQIHGFTTTEGALARLLLQGSNLAAAAQAMNVGMATVRSHLRGLLAKTGTHRQADLVRVLLQGISPIE